MANKNNEKEIYCSFCGKPQDMVARLIAGNGAYICDSCVDSVILISLFFIVTHHLDFENKLRITKTSTIYSLFVDFQHIVLIKTDSLH